jgi:hypothetical protein
MLANNIVSRNYSQLLSPLGQQQVAPIGFLYVEKFFFILFKGGAFSLRLVPFLCYLISVPLFYRLAFLVSKNKNISIFSCALFALNAIVINYSNEVKQYSVDVLLAIAIFLTGLRYLEDFSKKSTSNYAMVSSVAIIFSNVSLISILIFNSAIVIRLLQQKDNKLILQRGWPLLLNTILFLTYYFYFIYGHPSQAGMITFWENAKAFLPKNIFSMEFVEALDVKLLQNLDWIITLIKFQYLKVAIIVFGVVFAFLKNKKVLFFVMPVTIHLTLSYFDLYPFHQRLILYLTPFTIFLFSYGLINLLELPLKRFNISINILLVVPLIFMSLAVHKEMPRKREEIKESISYMNQRIKENDQIYVYYGGASAFKFHKDEFVHVMNKSNLIYGASDRQKREKYITDLNKLDDNVWLIFSHVHKNKRFDLESEEDFLVSVMDSLGYETVENFSGYNSRALKYTKKSEL